MRVRPFLAAWVLGSLLALPVSAGVSEGHTHSGGGAGSADGEGSPSPRIPLRQSEEAQRSYFTDLALVDQDGREVRFYTDVLKGRTVVVSFIFTNCMDVCPLLMANLSEVKTLLGGKMGREVHFVSISVDPEDDTPEELKKYADRWEAGPGWTFLTGRKDRIDWVTYKLGQYTPDFQEHSMLLLLGDVKTGRWVKVPGNLPPEAIVERIETLLHKREKGD